LVTHLAAMSLFVDSYHSDIEDLRNDLRLERPKMIGYFRELGCVVDSPNENEKGKIKLKNQDPRGHKVARLKIPLEFPKPRTGSGYKRR
jgi:DNA-directed RNA polymerase I subunit RPA49